MKGFLAQDSGYLEEIRNDWQRQIKPSYTRDQERAGLRAYRAALREQERLIDDGTYAETCGRCIGRFPRLSSIFISDGVPQALNLDSKSNAETPTLLERHHPNLLLREFSDGCSFESADRHVGNVLRALTIANVQIEKLVTLNGWGPSYNFAKNRVPEARPLDLSKLSRLDLCLRDGWYLSRGPDRSSAICPLLEQLPVLTELYLRFCANKNRFATVAELWSLSAAELTTLAVEGLKFSGRAFCDFLRRHHRLGQLTLDYVGLTDGHWIEIFEVLREHPELQDPYISNVDGRRPPALFFNAFRGFGELEVRFELQNNLRGDGDWTERLSEYWRRAWCLTRKNWHL